MCVYVCHLNLYPNSEAKLETPEQIAAWIAERKKRYPTAKRKQEKDEHDKQRRERGELVPGGENSKAAKSTRSKGRPCRYYSAGNCMKGDACTFTHDVSTSSQSSTGVPKRKGVKRNGLFMPAPVTSLLRQLLSAEVRRDNAIILQCFRFIANNGFLAGPYKPEELNLEAFRVSDIADKDNVPVDTSATDSKTEVEPSQSNDDSNAAESDCEQAAIVGAASDSDPNPSDSAVAASDPASVGNSDNVDHTNAAIASSITCEKSSQE
jgi:FMR1-interacting protein 1 (NUFIP1)